MSKTICRTEGYKRNRWYCTLINTFTWREKQGGKWIDGKRSMKWSHKRGWQFSWKCQYVMNFISESEYLDSEIKFISNALKNWKVELTAGGKTLAEGKIHPVHFLGDALSPWLVVIAMRPFYYIFRICTGG